MNCKFTIKDLRKMIMSMHCQIRTGDHIITCYEDDICPFCLTHEMIILSLVLLENEYL